MQRSNGIWEEASSGNMLADKLLAFLAYKTQSSTEISCMCRKQQVISQLSSELGGILWLRMRECMAVSRHAVGCVQLSFLLLCRVHVIQCIVIVNAFTSPCNGTFNMAG